MLELEQKELKLKELKEELKKKENEISPLKESIKNLKNEIDRLIQDEKYKDFDEIMRKYYTHKLPNVKGSDITYLYNLWNNEEDEPNMEELFKDDYDRYRTYDVAELLWEYGCARNWLEARNVSDKTINGLSLWYELQFIDFNKLEWEQYGIKSINDIPENERAAVLEYIRLFNNIIVSKCIYDW